MPRRPRRTRDSPPSCACNRRRARTRVRRTCGADAPPRLRGRTAPSGGAAMPGATLLMPRSATRPAPHGRRPSRARPPARCCTVKDAPHRNAVRAELAHGGPLDRRARRVSTYRARSHGPRAKAGGSRLSCRAARGARGTRTPSCVVTARGGPLARRARRALSHRAEEPQPSREGGRQQAVMPRRPRRTRDSHPLVRVQPALDAGDDRLEFTGGAMIRAGHPRRNGLHRRGKRHTAELHVSENKTRPETLLRDQDGDPTSEKTNKGQSTDVKLGDPRAMVERLRSRACTPLGCRYRPPSVPGPGSARPGAAGLNARLCCSAARRSP